MSEEVPRTIPEIAVRAFESKQFRQLSAGKIERETGLEPDQYCFREETDGVAGAE